MQVQKLESEFREILTEFEHEQAKLGTKHYLVACSGGADSLALWQLLASNLALAKHVTLVHIWHNLRKEAEFEYYNLKTQVDALQGQLLAFSVDVNAYAKVMHFSEEVTARELRRMAFSWASTYYTKVEHNSCYLCLAQHLDDQAETVFNHCLKGTGMRGLAGIWPLKEHCVDLEAIKLAAQADYIQIIPEADIAKAELEHFLDTQTDDLTYTAWRPLLKFTKADLLAYVKARGLNYADDQSNKDTRYERNFLRQTILPAVLTGFPKAASKLANLASLAQTELEVTDYLLQTNLELNKQVVNLSKSINLPGKDQALAITFQPDSTSILPIKLVQFYWQRLLAELLPDLLITQRQLKVVESFILKAWTKPSKQIQFFSLNKQTIVVLLDRCLVVYVSPDLHLADKKLATDLVIAKCKPFFLAYYGKLLPLASNWPQYFELIGDLPASLELRAAQKGDYLLVEQKQLALEAYFKRLPLPSFLYSELLVLVKKNTQHVQHLFFRNLRKKVEFKAK